MESLRRLFPYEHAGDPMNISLRAQITIDLQAADFAEAANHQHQLEELLNRIREVYRGAALEFRERRPRPPRSLPARRALKHYTGAVSRYEDA
jgi:hypothetical protein